MAQVTRENETQGTVLMAMNTIQLSLHYACGWPVWQVTNQLDLLSGCGGVEVSGDCRGAKLTKIASKAPQAGTDYVIGKPVVIGSSLT